MRIHCGILFLMKTHMLGIDSDILEIEGLAIFVFEAVPNCWGAILVCDDFEHVGWFEGFEKSFPCEGMASFSQQVIIAQICSPI